MPNVRLSNPFGYNPFYIKIIYQDFTRPNSICNRTSLSIQRCLIRCLQRFPKHKIKNLHFWNTPFPSLLSLFIHLSLPSLLPALERPGKCRRGERARLREPAIRVRVVLGGCYLKPRKTPSASAAPANSL